MDLEVDDSPVETWREDYRKTVAYLASSSKSTDYTIRLVKRKSINEIFTVLRLFEHIGELKLFEFILHKVVKNEGLVYYHNEDTIAQFKKLHNLGSSTLHNYIRSMVNKEILFKLGNGRYRVNEDYVIVTGKKDEIK